MKTRSRMSLAMVNNYSIQIDSQRTRAQWVLGWGPSIAQVLMSAHVGPESPAGQDTSLKSSFPFSSFLQCPGGSDQLCLQWPPCHRPAKRPVTADGGELPAATEHQRRLLHLPPRTVR